MHRNVSRHAAGFLVGLIIGISLCLFVGYEWGQPAPATQCQEDDPCWNCATMGNHLCGN